jgi:hypothetical protein
VTTADLHERGPRPRRRRRQPHLDQQLAGPGGRGEVSDEKLFGFHDPPPASAPHHQLSAEGGHHGGQLSGWISVSEAPAHRPPVADLHVTDLGHRLGQEGAAIGHQRRRLHGTLASHGTDHEVSIVLADAGELAEPVEVHHVLGPDEPEVHERHQALATGQRFGAVAEIGQQRQGLLYRGRGEIVEGRGFHGGPRPSRPDAVTARRGPGRWRLAASHG